MTKILRYFVRVVMMLFPVFFLPIIMDAYGIGKVIFLLAMGMIGIVLWLAGMILEKKEEIKFNFGWLWFLVLAIWAGAMILRLPVGIQMKSLLGIGGLGTIITVVIWGFLWLQVKDKEEVKKQLDWLSIGGIITVVASLVVFLIPASKLPFIWPSGNPILSIGIDWSITGTLLTELALVLFLAWEWGKRLWLNLKENNNYIVSAILTAVFVLAIGLVAVRIQKTGWISLDANTGWNIAVETLKRKPLTGVGIGNFSEAFSLYRPASYNNTKFWTSGFNISSNQWLQLWTELGIVGLGLIVFVIVFVSKQKKNFDWLRIVVFGLVFLFFPTSAITWWLFMWLLVTGIEETRKIKLVLKIGEKGINAAPWLLTAILVGLMVWAGINTGKLIAADYYYRQSLVAASKNDGGTTYNLQIKAISLNPLSAEYRRIYSQTNLALAVTLLSKEGVEDVDKEKASVLIQQSVREGKAAVSLNQMDVANWSNLAQVYRQLVGVVEGAADWSFQAYQQSVVLDPTNPSLSLDLGGLLYAAGRYEEADRMFEQAVMNKSDFPNAWYNWAYSAKQLNRLGDAVSRLNQAVALVPVTSGDYEKASKELEAWRKEYDEAVKRFQQQQQPKQPETLKTPEPLPTTGKEEKVNIPAGDLEPPAPMVTAEPTEGEGGP